MASIVTLQCEDLTKKMHLFEGRVHIPTIKEAVALCVAKINGVLEPSDSQGFTHAKFNYGDTFNISGTPAEVAATPGTLQPV